MTLKYRYSRVIRSERFVKRKMALYSNKDLPLLYPLDQSKKLFKYIDEKNYYIRHTELLGIRYCLDIKKVFYSWVLWYDKKKNKKVWDG